MRAGFIFVLTILKKEKARQEGKNILSGGHNYAELFREIWLLEVRTPGSPVFILI